MFAYAGQLQYLFCLLEGKVSSSLLRQDRMEVSIPCVRHFGFTTPFMSNYGLVCLAPVLFRESLRFACALVLMQSLLFRSQWSWALGLGLMLIKVVILDLPYCFQEYYHAVVSLTHIRDASQP